MQASEITGSADAVRAKSDDVTVMGEAGEWRNRGVAETPLLP